MKFLLVEVDRFPSIFQEGTIYWTREFKISAHLCACGCGDVIYLPIGPMDYAITIHSQGPTLRPSVGNWNVCNAHYFITNGQVQWAVTWNPEQVAAGRAYEDTRRENYYKQQPRSLIQILLGWVRSLWRR